MVTLWQDWCLMDRLHCTYGQLQQEPFEETQIFKAFMRGEAQAQQVRVANAGTR